MSQSTRFRSIAWALALGAVLVGCDGEASGRDPGPIAGRDLGWLIIDWTVNGVKNVDQCDLSGSSTVGVTVTTASGAPAGALASGAPASAHQAPCTAFGTTITLAPGSYRAEAVLLDGRGSDLATPVKMQPFKILAGNPSWVPIDLLVATAPGDAFATNAPPSAAVRARFTAK